MFFDNWYQVLRTIVVGICAYAVLVVMLRVSGKRTLTKMNAFDLVVTVALGSTLASIITSRQVALLDGIVALALLIGLQVGVAWTASRAHGLNKVLKSQPRLLFHNGMFLQHAMHSERITEDEVLAAAREHGAASLDDIAAVVLESSGEISVLLTHAPERSTLRGIRAPELEQVQ